MTAVVKTYALSACVLCVLSACNSRPRTGEAPVQPDTTTVQVVCDSVDIGTILAGDSAIIDYMIWNIGNAPLVIQDILPSCDCTTARFDKKDVLPGDSMVFTLIYHPESISGYLYRTAEVVCNSKSAIELTFTGKIAEE